MNTNSQIVTDDNIQVDKPELYLYDNCQVLNIYKARYAYSIVFAYAGGSRHCWVEASELTLKPQFKPEVGKYYQFSDRDNFSDYVISEFIGIEEGYFLERITKWHYCRPIPKDLKELFVFEE